MIQHSTLASPRWDCRFFRHPSRYQLRSAKASPPRDDQWPLDSRINTTGKVRCPQNESGTTKPCVAPWSWRSSPADAPPTSQGFATSGWYHGQDALTRHFGEVTGTPIPRLDTSLEPIYLCRIGQWARRRPPVGPPAHKRHFRAGGLVCRRNAGKGSLFIVRPLGGSGSREDQRGRSESRRLVPVASGDDEGAARGKSIRSIPSWVMTTSSMWPSMTWKSSSVSGCISHPGAGFGPSRRRPRSDAHRGGPTRRPRGTGGPRRSTGSWPSSRSKGYPPGV